MHQTLKQVIYLGILFCLTSFPSLPATAVTAEEPAKAYAAQSQQQNIATFRKFIQTYKKEKRIVSLSATIAIDGKILYSEGLGWQDHDAEEPTTTDTSYLVASISKTFSAATLLNMEADELLSLDDDFTELSDWKERCEWLKSSGSIFGGGTLDDGTLVEAPQCDTPITLRQVLQHRVQGKPGTSFFYNPVVFGRLSNWVEEKTGKPFDYWIDVYVLKPGKLDNIAAVWRDSNKSHVLTHLAPAFRFDKDRSNRPVLSVSPNPEMNASSGIIASAESLARYSIALDQGSILTPELREKMWSPPIDEATGNSAPYAYGWYVENWKGNRLVWHSGWWPDAYAGFLLKAPDKRITLAIFANTDGLWWPSALNAADIEKSPVAQKFLELFVE
jgi:CubicO group peptidase (beta-lactamase class C family)